jgi:hypothetical protein
MQTRTRKTEVTFRRPFTLEGFDEVLPAGVYRVESDDDILDAMFLPECLRASAVLHLHARPGSPMYTQTLTVPWQELEMALARDRGPAATPVDPDLDEMPMELIARLVMRRDGTPKAEARHVISPMSKKGRYNAIAER